MPTITIRANQSGGSSTETFSERGARVSGEERSRSHTRPFVSYLGPQA
jgi:hypothetical protein